MSASLKANISDTEPARILDLSDRQVKLDLMQDIGKRTGLHYVSIEPRKFNRTNKQNSYWWAAIVKPFCDYLREQWGDPTITMEQAHIELKLAVLGPKEIKGRNGDSKLLIPSSHDLNTLEFSVLCDKARQWLSEHCEIEVISAEDYMGVNI